MAEHTETESPLTVFVVDDDMAVRDSLQWLISSIGLHVEVFASGQAFLDLINADRPGCLVLDVRLPSMSGLELHNELIARGIRLPTIMITGHGDVSMAVRAMKSGVVDFIEKPFSDQMLLERIHLAIERDTEDRQKRAEQAELFDRYETLSPREQQVMELVAQAMSNRQCAQILELSQKTVEVHRGHLMKKMQASNVADLVRMSLAIRRVSEAPIPID